jgi:small subunit ribosomal protein S3
MGQKVHPESLRVGYIHDWKSNWFNERHFADYLERTSGSASTSTASSPTPACREITIRKDANEVEINIHTARRAS